MSYITRKLRAANITSAEYTLGFFHPRTQVSDVGEARARLLDAMMGDSECSSECPDTHRRKFKSKGLKLSTEYKFLTVLHVELFPLPADIKWRNKQFLHAVKQNDLDLAIYYLDHLIENEAQLNEMKRKHQERKLQSA